MDGCGYRMGQGTVSTRVGTKVQDPLTGCTISVDNVRCCLRSLVHCTRFIQNLRKYNENLLGFSNKILTLSIAATINTAPTSGSKSEIILLDLKKNPDK